MENPAIADGAVNVLAYERSGLAGRGCLRAVARRGIVPGAAASVPPGAKPHNRSAAFVPFRGIRPLHRTCRMARRGKLVPIRGLEPRALRLQSGGST